MRTLVKVLKIRNSLLLALQCGDPANYAQKRIEAPLTALPRKIWFCPSIPSGSSSALPCGPKSFDRMITVRSIMYPVAVFVVAGVRKLVFDSVFALKIGTGLIKGAPKEANHLNCAAPAVVWTFPPGPALTCLCMALNYLIHFCSCAISFICPSLKSPHLAFLPLHSSSFFPFVWSGLRRYIQVMFATATWFAERIHGLRKASEQRSGLLNVSSWKSFWNIAHTISRASLTLARTYFRLPSEVMAQVQVAFK